MKAKFLSMLAIAALVFTSCSDDDSNGGPSPENNELAGNMTQDRTLDADVEYKLTGALIVKNG